MKACKDYPGKYDCENVWTSFVEAFVGKDPCKVPPEDYASLMNIAPPNSIRNKLLFWSKTQAIVDALAKKRPDCFMVSMDTLLGFVMNKLDVWCGKKGSKEIFTTGCPEWTKCVNNPVRSFWSQFSKALAMSASGSVHIVLSGSVPSPFSPDSILATEEIVNFNPSKISSLTVVVVQTSNTKSCNTDNLKDLEKYLDHGLKAKYTCKDVKESTINDCTNSKEKTCAECFSQLAA